MINCINRISVQRRKHLFWLMTVVFLRVLTFSDDVYSRDNKAMKPDREVCKYVISYANRGAIDRIAIPEASQNSALIKEPEDLVEGNINNKYIMDVNNDGIPERVFISAQGSLNYGLFSVYRLETDEEIPIKKLWDSKWSDDVERWSARREFIKFRGVTYVLGRTGQSLDYLLFINPFNEIGVVCEFGQKEKPFKRSKISRNGRLCELASNNNLEYVKFTEPHDVTGDVLKKATSGKRSTYMSKAATIDINNDGKKEPVIRFVIPCSGYEDVVHLAILTADRRDLDNKTINTMPSSGCGESVEPFMFNGKTYLAYTTGAGNPKRDVRRVAMLNRDRINIICVFEIRPINTLSAIGQKKPKTD